MFLVFGLLLSDHEAQEVSTFSPGVAEQLSIIVGNIPKVGLNSRSRVIAIGPALITKTLSFKARYIVPERGEGVGASFGGVLTMRS